MDDSAISDSGFAGVPQTIRRSTGFQRWHQALRVAGHALERAEVLWTLESGTGVADFWAMRVSVRVAAEHRVKANEVVVSRPDLSVVALFQPAVTLDDSVVVLIREFRSPVRNSVGFVHELPGGSGGEADPRAQAVAEIAEEIGLAVEPGRLRAHGGRQLVATQSTHHAQLFSVRINYDELRQLRRQSSARGADAEERTWIRITTFGEVRRGRLVDWAMLGMLTQALLAEADVTGSG